MNTKNCWTITSMHGSIDFNIGLSSILPINIISVSGFSKFGQNVILSFRSVFFIFQKKKAKKKVKKTTSTTIFFDSLFVVS